jgi:hypothetical protein
LALGSISVGSRADFESMNRAIALHRLRPMIDCSSCRDERRDNVTGPSSGGVSGAGGRHGPHTSKTVASDAIWPDNPTFNHFYFRFRAVNVGSLDAILGAVSKFAAARIGASRWVLKHPYL